MAGTSRASAFCFLALLAAQAVLAQPGLTGGDPPGRSGEVPPGRDADGPPGQAVAAAARAVGKAQDVRVVGNLLKPEGKGKFREPQEDAQVVLGEYLVTFADAADPADVARVARDVAKPQSGAQLTYFAAEAAGWKGFTFSAPADAAAAAALLDALLAEPSVAHVATNQLLQVHARDLRAKAAASKTPAPSPSPSPSPRPSPSPSPAPAPACFPDTFLSAYVTDSVRNWGLDRIDSRANDVVAKGAGPYAYRYATSGASVAVYVIDTGVELTHPELNGRAFAFFDVQTGAATTDANGHGTHKAGIVAGATVGVAKAATIYSARVMDAAGLIDSSSVIRALNAVVNVTSQPKRIALMALGSPLDAALNSAVESAVAAGVLVVTTAGNGNGADACAQSPGSAPSAITVAATGVSDNVLALSNIGSCVDIFAPGDSIYSSWIGGAYAASTGTSSAAPFVAGVAARLWAKGACVSALDCTAKVKCAASQGLVTGTIGTSPNLLLSLTPNI